MRLSTQTLSISYLRAHAAEVFSDIADTHQPVVITQNGEAKAVLQDIASFEWTQETMTLLKLLALGQQDIDVGSTKLAVVVADRLRAKANRSDD